MKPAFSLFLDGSIRNYGDPALVNFEALALPYVVMEEIPHNHQPFGVR